MTSPLKPLLEGMRSSGQTVSPTQFLACGVPGSVGHYIAWNGNGAPCLLIETSDIGFRAPLKLSALEVQFCVPCDVVLPDGECERRQLSVVTCTSTDNDLRDYFLHLMDTVIQIVGNQPALSIVDEAIGKLVEILQQLGKPPSRNVMGLFAELFVIAVSRNPLACVIAWRAKDDDRFDFALENARLETKATSDRIRAHYFSVEQCLPPRGTTAVIASLFVEQSGGGQSLGELIDQVVGRLEGDPRALFKLRAVVANSLGASLPAALQMRFDHALARSTLAFYSATDIPAIRSPIPHGVSAVRFRSDLTGIAAGTVDGLSQVCPALRIFFPS